MRLWILILLFSHLGFGASKSKLNSMIGLELVSGGSGVMVGAQFGHQFLYDKDWFLGVESHIVVNSPGSITSFLVGGWDELNISQSSRIVFGYGIWTGIAASSYFPPLSPTLFELWTDFFLAQEIDSLTAIRAQFRPGVVGGYLAFVMNLSITFEFL